MEYIYYYAAILIGLAIGSLFYPPIAVTAVFLMFSLEQWGQRSSKYLLTNSSFTNICVGLIVCFAFLRVVLSKKIRLFNNYPFVALLIFMLYSYSFVSLQWSNDLQKGLSLWGTFFPYITIAVILSPFLINSEKDVLLASNALQFFGMPLLVLLLFFAEWEQRRLVIVGGPDPILGNPLEIGTLSAMLFVTAIFQKIKQLGKLSIIFSIVLAILSAGLLVVSGSRGQFFSVLVAVYFLWVFRYKISNPIQFIFAGFFIASITYILIQAVSLMGDNNIRWEQGKVSEDITGRLNNSLILLSNWSKSFGSMFFGLGNSSSYKILGIYPHNVPAEIVCEEGLIGFILYGLILIRIIVAFKRVLKLTDIGSDSRNSLVLLFGYLLMTFILSLKQGSFLSNVYFFMFAIMLFKYENYILTKNTKFIKPT